MLKPPTQVEAVRAIFVMRGITRRVGANSPTTLIVES
jgi:hypothetical protein